MGDRRTKERPRQEQKLGQTNHSPHKSSPEEYSRLRLTHIRAPRGRRIDCELDHAIRKKLLTVRDHPRSKANMVASRNWVPPLFVFDLDQEMSVRGDSSRFWRARRWPLSGDLRTSAAPFAGFPLV